MDISPQVDATRAPPFGSTGSEATGLAPPSMIAKGIGSVSVRTCRDGFAYVLRNKPSPPSIELADKFPCVLVAHGARA
jgi:hypothetical protein